MVKNSGLAAKIYEKAKSAKAGPAYLAAGMAADAQRVMGAAGANVDFLAMIKESITTNPQQALDLAKQFSKGGKVQAGKVAEIFMSANRLQELTNFCIECMTGNLPEEGQWQTVVLELCCKTNPSMAEQIFSSGRWSHYNK